MFDCGEEALSKLAAKKPALILLDIYMPKMDGVECLRKIKEIDKEALAILVTSNNDAGIARKTLKLGTIDYITKPLGFNALETVVTRIFSFIAESNPPKFYLPYKPLFTRAPSKTINL
ncbi:response regulator [Candidatus Omnitrophota bacterium]